MKNDRNRPSHGFRFAPPGGMSVAPPFEYPSQLQAAPSGAWHLRPFSSGECVVELPILPLVDIPIQCAFENDRFPHTLHGKSFLTCLEQRTPLKAAFCRCPGDKCGAFLMLQTGLGCTWVIPAASCAVSGRCSTCWLAASARSNLFEVVVVSVIKTPMLKPTCSQEKEKKQGKTRVFEQLRV